MRLRLGWTLLCAGLALSATELRAAAPDVAYPTKPIRIIVPYPPGGSTDPTARAYGNWLSEKFGAPAPAPPSVTRSAQRQHPTVTRCSSAPRRVSW